MATRYRCTACANLTRFDLTIERHSREFHHYSVGGELEIDGVELLQEKVCEVACRWCGNADAVEEIG